MKIRDFWVSWRRYRFGMLLLSVCLSAILASPQVAMSTQPSTTSMVGAEIAKTPLPKTSKTPISPVKSSLTLTANVKKTVLENGLTILTKEVHNAPVGAHVI
jgi:zinc protease